MRWVDDVMRMADDRKKGEIPWHVPAFATDGAVRGCEARGVRCAPMGAGIAPDKDDTKFIRKALERLRGTLGPEPFRNVGAQCVHDYEEQFLGRLALVADQQLDL